MKSRKILLGVCACLALNSLYAQKIHLQPVPQQYTETKDSLRLSGLYRLEADDASGYHHVKSLLKACLSDKEGAETLPIYIGVKGDKSVRKFAKRIPDRAEAYYLNVDKKGIVVAGHDERGLFYGVQTLLQLLKYDKVPVLEIKDYPDLPYRGVVEGFYGVPWSHEARLSQIEFYGKNKMNVYLYGPKDDPYHSTPNWRKPYPEKEAAQLKELVEKAKENEVIFYWAIHPGQDIQWNDADRNALVDKFEKMYQLGVRAFAVFFDDISGIGTDANRQAELLNYLDDHFVKVKGDVAPLVMCPTEYNKSWSRVEGGYLSTLGKKLNRGIEIMWTGDRVIACIDQQSLDFINPLIQRKAYIWWNFPVSDYVRDHLLMGSAYGNSNAIKDGMGGFVSNPMEHPEASKISLYGVADYAWNLEKFDSEVSWKNAIKDLMPSHSNELEVFASHNSDLGKNGHGFRREESVAVQPALNALLSGYQQHTIDEEAYVKVLSECNRIVRSADILLSSAENRELIEDIRPWLIQFKLLGEYGREVLRLLRIDVKAADGQQLYLETYEHIRALAMQMSEVDATYNQNPYQPGVKTGSKCLLPTFNALFEQSVLGYNALFAASLKAEAGYTPYQLKSNVRQLEIQPIRQKGKGGEVSPSNEVIIWQAGGELVVSMDHKRTLKELVFDLGDSQVVEKCFKLSVTEDGEVWQDVAFRKVGGRTVLLAEVEGKKVKAIRLKNTSSSVQKVFFKLFRFTEE